MGTIRSWAIRQTAKVYEALSGSAVGQSYGSDEDTQLRGFRPLSERAGGSMKRDLSTLSQEQMLKVAHFLYTSNPLAKFLIDIPTAVVLGKRVEFCLEFDHDRLGITKEYADAEVARARGFLDPWWTHPAHDFAGRSLKYARTFLITGELPLLVTVVNPITGLFQTDYIDSQLIAGVQGLNRLSSVPGVLLIKPAEAAQEPERHDIAREGAFPGEGGAFFFHHAGRLNSMRGFSYLLDVGDWIDSHDQSFFGQLDRTILGNSIVHDLKVEGAQTDEDLKKHTKQFRDNTGKSGGVFAHNEKVTHEVKTPNMQHADNEKLQRGLLLYVLGSKGIPEHWFGSGDSTNRAVGETQNDVAIMVMEAFQDELAGIFRLPLTIAYDELAKRQGFPPRSEGVRIYPILPKISQNDITKIGSVFAQTEAALDSAVAGERLSNATARKVTYAIVEKITGEAVDAYAEAAAIETEAEDRAEKQDKANEDAAHNAAKKLAGAVKDDEEAA